MPIALVRLLEGFVNAIVRQGGIRELQDLFELAMAHAFHRHVNRIGRGLVKLIHDDKINRNTLEPSPASHSPEIEKAVPNLLDIGRVCVFHPGPDDFRVFLNQGCHSTFAEIDDVAPGGEKIEHSPETSVPSAIDRSKHGQRGQTQLGSFHESLIRMVILVGLDEVFMPFKGEGLPIQDDRQGLSPLTQWQESLIASVNLLINGTQESIV
jgi:hypothetical protein